MAKDTLFVDIECYANFFYIGFKRLDDGRRVGFEYSNRSDFDRMRVRRITRKSLTVGFHSREYDIPMIFLALSGASNEDLKRASDRIIKGGLRWWEVERALGIVIPKIDHIDLFDPNPAVMDSLKTLNGRLHGKRLQDLPYDEATVLTHEQMDTVADYCLTSDLDATENLYNALREPLEFREALGKQYGMDFRSRSDAQMGEAMIKRRVEELTGKRADRAAEKLFGTTFRYSVPDFIEFESAQMRDVVETIRKTDLIIDRAGKVQFPKAFEKFAITIGGSTYRMGIGGLHSTESSRAVLSDDTHVLVDADVATYLAIKADGKAKRKGPIANHWHPASPDYDPGREQMKKNPQMTICGDAVLAFLRDGVPIEKTIREATDFRGFVTVVKATGGGTWRDQYLGKVVRYYWSTDGDPIIKVKGHPSTGNRPKVGKTDGCRPAMMLPDGMPADVDFARYIAEAYSILESVGYVSRPSIFELLVNQLLTK